MMSDAPARLREALSDRYRIERELGAGGMATVYLAEDLRHDRKVALKVLRPELAAVIGAARFLQEIKTTANLQHPHILALHDSGEVDGTVFYVMPYIEGESLRDRLTREKQLPVEDAVRITREVAGALDYAHRHGVIHRDIKPENILLHDGSALVADFGIALAASRTGAGRMTETGMSLGTPHYMSPEQAMGERELDARSDVYALGCVAYEMLSGEPPFTGPTAQAIIARVVTEEPRSLTLQRKTIPPHVEAAVNTALCKLPADRFASAAEFAVALGNPNYGTIARAQGDGRVGAPSALRSNRPIVIAATVSGLVLGALGLFLGLRARPATEPQRTVRFTLALPDSARYQDTFGRSVAVSPDGSAIVYPGGTPGHRQLFLRRLDAQRPTPIPGTDGAYMPFYSPDGEWLGFVANQRVMKVRLAGGAPTSIVQLQGNSVSGAAWGALDDIVLEDVRGLSHVSASGGRLTQMVNLDSVNPTMEWPSFLPDGRSVLFSVVRANGAHLAVASVPDGHFTVFEELEGTDPRYLEPGLLLWTASDGVMLAARFDAKQQRVIGKPVPALEGIVEDGRAGKVALGPGIAVQVEGGAQGAQLLRVNRQGVARRERAEEQAYASPRFSPDSRRIALTITQAGGGGGGGDIWILDRVRGTRQRLTLNAPANWPEWSPDGRRLAFGYIPSTSWDVYSAAADGSSPAESLVVSPRTEIPGGWTPNGVFVFTRLSDNRNDILYRDPQGKEHPFAASAASETAPSLSPDGRWLAFVSDGSGTREVYVRPFPTGEGRWQISVDGGVEPRWSKNGREIIYRDGELFLAVPVVPGSRITIGQMDTLFRGPYSTSTARATYDVSRDGSELILVGAASDTRTLIVTLHPFDQLLDKLRRPAPR